MVPLLHGICTDFVSEANATPLLAAHVNQNATPLACDLRESGAELRSAVTALRVEDVASQTNRVEPCEHGPVGRRVVVMREEGREREREREVEGERGRGREVEREREREREREVERKTRTHARTHTHLLSAMLPMDRTMCSQSSERRRYT